jgi:hypothetical protein
MKSSRTAAIASTCVGLSLLKGADGDTVLEADVFTKPIADSDITYVGDAKTELKLKEAADCAEVAGTMNDDAIPFSGTNQEGRANDAAKCFRHIFEKQNKLFKGVTEDFNKATTNAIVAWGVLAEADAAVNLPEDYKEKTLEQWTVLLNDHIKAGKQVEDGNNKVGPYTVATNRLADETLNKPNNQLEKSGTYGSLIDAATTAAGDDKLKLLEELTTTMWNNLKVECKPEIFTENGLGQDYKMTTDVGGGEKCSEDYQNKCAACVTRADHVKYLTDKVVETLEGPFKNLQKYVYLQKYAPDLRTAASDKADQLTAALKDLTTADQVKALQNMTEDQGKALKIKKDADGEQVMA